RADPGLPTHGVIVLCDFGGSGASITLANAARDFSQFGETVRFPDFSGDHIDQALLTHVVAGLVDVDPSGTAMVGSLARLAELLAVLDDPLERYGVPLASVSAVATVGGGARVPVIIQRLSEHLRAPVVTTRHPQLTAAEGAALLAQ